MMSRREREDLDRYITREEPMAYSDPAWDDVVRERDEAVAELRRLRGLLDGDDAEFLLALWDEMDAAAQRIVTALPFQMTDAASRLEMARKEFRRRLQEYLRMRRP